MPPPHIQRVDTEAIIWNEISDLDLNLGRRLDPNPHGKKNPERIKYYVKEKGKEKSTIKAKCTFLVYFILGFGCIDSRYYCVSKKSCPNLFSSVLYTKSQDIQYVAPDSDTISGNLKKC